MSNQRALRVALIAGEASGDLLGAGLMRALQLQRPGTRFFGVGGDEMLAAGLQGWAESRELAVMGLSEVIAHLPRLLRLRARILGRIQQLRPDLLVGIDAPDFNIPVERRARAFGITTLHYVSPSVWAWRPGRARKMAAAADRVLCLLPFEPDFYTPYGIKADYVGHPLADRIAWRTDKAPARIALGMNDEQPAIAVLPGSRGSELQRLGPVFLQAAVLLSGRVPGLQFVLPVADRSLMERVAQLREKYAPGIDLRLTIGQAQQAIAAADAVMVASGTATLEAVLIKRPMVVGYRVSPVTRWLLETFKLLKIDHFALPNLLSESPLVPELIQDDLQPESLSAAMLEALQRDERDPGWLAACDQIHTRLRCNADQRAAQIVLDMLA